MNPTLLYLTLLLAPPAAWGISRLSTWPWAYRAWWGRDHTAVKRQVENEIAWWFFGLVYIFVIGIPLGHLSAWALAPAPVWTLFVLARAKRRIGRIRANGGSA